MTAPTRDQAFAREAEHQRVRASATRAKAQRRIRHFALPPYQLSDFAGFSREEVERGLTTPAVETEGREN